MNIQHILTLSIEAFALSFAAMMAIDFTIAVVKLWCSVSASLQVRRQSEKLGGGFCLRQPSQEKAQVTSQDLTCDFVCAATLAPIWDEEDDKAHSLPLTIRELKKQASAAKVKNYNVMTKAQLIEALSA